MVHVDHFLTSHPFAVLLSQSSSSRQEYCRRIPRVVCEGFSIDISCANWHAEPRRVFGC
jgi:hypothetical protein